MNQSRELGDGDRGTPWGRWSLRDGIDQWTEMLGKAKAQKQERTWTGGSIGGWSMTHNGERRRE